MTTAVAVHRGTRAPTGQGDKAVHPVAIALQEIDRQIAVVGEAATLLAAPWTKVLLDADARRLPSVWDLARRPDEKARVAAMLAALPALEEVQRLEARLLAGSSPSQAKLRQIVGLMIDAVPIGNVRAPEVYFESLVHEVEACGATLPAIAAGCRAVTRECKFLPAICEVLERIGKATTQLRSAGSALGMVCATRDRLVVRLEEVAAAEAEKLQRDELCAHTAKARL